MIRAKIDENGTLHLLRGDKLKKQGCLHGVIETSDVWCGDWCPAFEVVRGAGGTGTVRITGCCWTREYAADEFADERN